MKRAVILHGTDGNPEINWLPWARNALEQQGYEVYVPLLPENHTPNADVYERFLRDSGWDFANNLLIGHSSGATTALNLLATEWFPQQSAIVLVGAFLNERLTKSVDWYEPGQFDHLFPPDGFNEASIIQKAGKLFFIHGKDDPYCALEDTVELAKRIGGEVTIVPDGRHLSSNRSELPELLPIIAKV